MLIPQEFQIILTIEMLIFALKPIFLAISKHLLTICEHNDT